MIPLQTGNAPLDSAPFSGWLIGQLDDWAIDRGLTPPPGGYGLRSTGQLEVKWAEHPAGQARPGGWTAPSERITLSILIAGRFELRFRPAGDPAETVRVLAQPGDYALWSETIPHTWRVLEDAIVVTIRWPQG